MHLLVKFKRDIQRMLVCILANASNRLGCYQTKLTGNESISNLVFSLRPRISRFPLVRLGPDGDGGYLVPDDLDGISTCFSPGVANVSGFERDCARRGMTVYMADHSVDGPAEQHLEFRFTKKHVGAVDNDQYMTLGRWFAESRVAEDDDLLLQMDIEGAEYEVILSASNALLKRFRILVIEFHQLDNLFSKPCFGLMARAFEKILQTHSCVHIHPNNCCGLFGLGDVRVPRVAEFTFLRKDRDPMRAFASLPHPLDSDNTANPSIELPKSWFEPAKLPREP